ncbi:NAD-dependent glutamate dehydrogenase [Tieghemiomyces parasiticus]|uniref:NAD-specific glutamate dehydrogenase n=1 Tax=Tieghemiomyces parasiticus TaxID=78921 RepID=A0A9W7ZKY2_9FUNG|nr:NAD-dependent glutamate dehydrogenase [Tieghemiomyces parasiticus]
MATTEHSPDYSANIYEGKQDQMLRVSAVLEKMGFIPKELIQHEITWFYNNLGIDDMYFMLENDETIANHILALYGAQVSSFSQSNSELDINLEKESEDGAVFIHTSLPGVSEIQGPQHERRIDDNYLDISTPAKAYRLESYRSRGTVSEKLKAQLRCYFITRCDFVNAEPTGDQLRDIQQVSDRTFLGKATPNTLEAYQKVIGHVLDRSGPVLELHEIPNSRERRLIIGYRQGSTQHFFSAMSDLYHYYDLYSTRKYCENFSNGVTILSLYLNPLTNSKSPPIEHTIQQVLKEASLIYCIPSTPLQPLFQRNELSVQETTYGYVGWIFAQHFLNRLGSEYTTLAGALDSSDPHHIEVLDKIKKRLRIDTFTREYILDILLRYPELIKLLYVNFAMVHYVNPTADSSLKPTLSYQRLQAGKALTDDELLDKIRRTTTNSHEFMVFESLFTFNRHVLKTNMYQPTKVALSFRLNPAFLPDIEYPTPLYGMFLVVASEFRAFHLRFRDVARGGIRVIRSRNKEAYSINLRSLFDENYGLAATQQRKNKDIPEGGSKGTILLDFNQQDKSRVAFEKYVDSVLDLLLDGQTPGIKEKIVDLYGKPEILFFGPDEGTADFMDWASQHARRRGATFWKAFTTGKSQALGGIRHDIVGATTRSVHQYVLGILRKQGLKEDQVTKVQTGGPDGDLGSNEIKISHDKTLAVVDGSGVLYDPVGIDRTELTRLATARRMISDFDVAKLSAQGFRVLVDEYRVKLPNGTVVPDGFTFRNEFHLNPLCRAQFFVPCGGRPESVDMTNVHKMFDADGNPRFQYVVEGANLFFTQEARLRLEKAGIVVFKDASANKGGVTCSSMEVLAALAFDDTTFERDMMVRDPASPPTFYASYVKAVQQVIERNAELEFECLWREQKRTGKPRSILSDDLSVAVVKLNEELQHTTLWDDVALRHVVLSEALPKLLIDTLGMDNILARVPEAYTRAIFGAYLASRFVYKYGTEPSQFAFFEFMTPYFQKLSEVQ